MDVEKCGDAELFCGLKGDGEVLDHFVLAALAKVQCLWRKVRNQSAERKPVAPARVEVCHADCVQHSRSTAATQSALTPKRAVALCCPWRRKSTNRP